MSAQQSLKVVLVCGVAGVGKTSLIRDFVAGRPWAVTLSAGTIIAEARRISDPERLRTLPSNELERSQQLLVEGFSRILPTVAASLLLLDAHTVIDGNDGLYCVPFDVFERLKLDGVIHVEAQSAVIWERRRLDTQRVRPQRSVSDLAEYQRLSAERACQISSRLSTWIGHIEAGDQEQFERLLAPS